MNLQINKLINHECIFGLNEAMRKNCKQYYIDEDFYRESLGDFSFIQTDKGTVTVKVNSKSRVYPDIPLKKIKLKNKDFFRVVGEHLHRHHIIRVIGIK